MNRYGMVLLSLALVQGQVEPKMTAVGRCILSSFVIGLAHGACNQWWGARKGKETGRFYKPHFHEFVSGCSFFCLNDAMNEVFIAVDGAQAFGADVEDLLHASKVARTLGILFHGFGQIVGEAMPLHRDDFWKEPTPNLSLIRFLLPEAGHFLVA